MSITEAPYANGRLTLIVNNSRCSWSKYEPFNPTPVQGEYTRRKMAITPKNKDPKEPKHCDFSYTSMTDKKCYPGPKTNCS